MNRFVLALVSSASIAGGLVAMPSVARAQVVNVAPPAYSHEERRPSPRDPRAWPYSGGHEYGGTYARPYQPYQESWSRDAGREQWERIRQRHLRECVRAYEGGASPWVLARMQCPAY